MPKGPQRMINPDNVYTWDKVTDVTGRVGTVQPRGETHIEIDYSESGGSRGKYTPEEFSKYIVAHHPDPERTAQREQERKWAGEG